MIEYRIIKDTSFVVTLDFFDNEKGDTTSPLPHKVFKSLSHNSLNWSNAHEEICL